MRYTVHSYLTFFRKARGGFAPAFTPIIQDSTNHNSSQATVKPAATSVVSKKEAEESQAKIAAKKAKLSKFGLKFQSAGTLTSIVDELGTTVTTYKPPGVIQRLTEGTKESNEDTINTKKISFGINLSTTAKTFSTNTQDEQYTSVWTMPGDGKADPSLKPITKGPPPKLMSRQRELNMEKAFGEDSSDEDELTLVPIKRGPVKFKFKLSK